MRRKLNKKKLKQNDFFFEIPCRLLRAAGGIFEK
jgi:hypothetical protein